MKGDDSRVSVPNLARTSVNKDATAMWGLPTIIAINKLAAEGKSNSEIDQRLGIRRGTHTMTQPRSTPSVRRPVEAEQAASPLHVVNTGE